MKTMLKFKIEDSFMLGMVDCLLKGDSNGLENLKAGAIGFYKGISIDPVEAERLGENMVKIANCFAFGEEKS